MRFNDIQDTRKTEDMKVEKTEMFRRLHEECMRKIAGIRFAERLANINGVIFAV